MRLSVASSLSLASALVAATPLVSEGSLQARDDVDALTTTGYDDMKYYVQYAASAYCNSNDAVGALVTCEDGCPSVMANGATVVGTLPNTTTLNLEGFVAVDTVREEIVVAFRGSSSLRNWIADLDFVKVSCDYTSGCKVHDGFKDAWDEVSSYCFEYVEKAYASYPDYTLVVTGHSLGAAVGTLAAVELRIAGYPCDLYTYGSPRVGNLAFAEFVTAQAGAEYRATHYDDPVPRLPPIWAFGYYHTSPEYWLASGPNTDISYTISEIEICPGYANTSCNAGTYGLDTTAHSYYFQYMGCDTDDDSTDIQVKEKRGGGEDGSPLWARDDVSNAELTQRLNNYTTEDIAYTKELGINGSE
ncbi:Mono- and diacylglycerol lipase [Cytospora mali]|uniref:Mono-and diacylglycerol lipase n=1 Tax=Cytospora mali TaxID=578113 RepID=A0A194V9Z4_CYTMA|nr:Mono- and diacylglycerol lipase [Valsa mali var. pyri (nom. inval.)]